LVLTKVAEHVAQLACPLKVDDPTVTALEALQATAVTGVPTRTYPLETAVHVTTPAANVHVVQPVPQAVQFPVVAFKTYPALQVKQTVLFVHVQHPVLHKAVHPVVVFYKTNAALHDVTMFPIGADVHEAAPAAVVGHVL
jgi:hypothetical protein